MSGNVKDMNAKYLIYFCKGIESVFDSQVLELIKSINEKKVFQKVFLFLGIKNSNDMQELRKRKIPKEIGVITFRSFPNYVFFNPLIRKELSRAIKNNNELFNSAIIHVREELMAWHLAKIFRSEFQNKILPDIRGANIEEIIENENLSKVKRYLKLLNNKRALKYLKNYRKITAVSETLKKYLVNKCGIKPDDIFVTPDLSGKCFIYREDQRDRIRKEMNLSNNDLLLLFSNGSTSQWQNWQDSDILKVLAEKGIKILNLSRYKMDHPNIINRFINYDDVPYYLNAADAGIIWSKRRTVTEVRSPVKFSEYLCCGLPIVANDSVDMITEYIKKTAYGILLSNIDELDIPKLSRLLSLDRNRIAEYGRNWVGIEKITSVYMKIYASLC